MSSDELRDAFRDLTGEVRITPDPYGRLMRRRRKRRMKTAGWTTAIAGGVAALLLGPIGLQGMAGPDWFRRPPEWPGTPVDGGLPLTSWTRRLIDSPTRGELASDKAFIGELTARLSQRDFHSMVGAKILFAEDIGERRIVLAARFSQTHYVAIYISGKRGGSSAELIVWEGPEPAMAIREMQPFMSFGHYTPTATEVIFTGVGLVPSGCQISTMHRANQSHPTWMSSPTRDYAIWPARNTVDLDAQVSCDGVVRYQGPLIDRKHIFQYSSEPQREEVVTEALRNARGSVPREVAHALVNYQPPYLAGPARILYGGPIPGTEETAYLAINRASSGGWQIQVRVGEQHLSMTTSADVGAPDAVFVVGGLTNLSNSLVVAPPGAVKLTVLDSARRVVAEADLVDGIGGIDAPEGSFRLEARDAEGQVIGTGELPLPQLPSAGWTDPAIENWD